MKLTSTWYKLALGAILIIIFFLLYPIYTGQLSFSPIAFYSGNFPVHWYGIIMAIGIYVAYTTNLRFASEIQTSIHIDHLASASIWAILGGIIGARALFVILKWSEFAGTPSDIFNLQGGGLSIHGAILGGIVAVILYAKQHQLNWFKLADLLVIGIPLGQIIGRFGNFINQEAYGGPTSLPWKMYIDPINRPVGLEDTPFYHPTFLYEAILLIGLFYIVRHVANHNAWPGKVFATYLMGYSVIRFITEFFRIDSDYIGILSYAQLASVIILIGGIAWNYLQHKSHDR
ncbi:MAG: prolipoprotein diacylglyceryl transferase [Patescibacteria group bacterium]